MNKSPIALFALVLFVAVISQSCSGGGSSSDSQGLSCSEVAGQYNTAGFLSDGRSQSGTLDIKSDCTFTASGELSGPTSGTLTAKNEDLYSGSGQNVNICHGPIDVEVEAVDEGWIVYRQWCT